MFKSWSLTLKLSLLPAVALLGLLLYVGYTSLNLSENDSRLDELENHTYPTLERADAVLFQFSRIPGLLNSAVAAAEPEILQEARGLLDGIGTKQQELQALTKDHAQRSQELEVWRSAIRRYADNALGASTQLINGKANFDDLRPSLDRMATDLAEANRLGDLFRSHAYQDFQSTLAQARTDNAATTRVGIILTGLLVILVSLGSWLLIRGIMATCMASLPR